MYDYKAPYIRAIKDKTYEGLQWRSAARRMATAISEMTADKDGGAVLSTDTILGLFGAPHYGMDGEPGAQMLASWLARAPHTRSQWLRFAEIMQEHYGDEGWTVARVLAFMGKGGGH